MKHHPTLLALTCITILTAPGCAALRRAVRTQEALEHRLSNYAYAQGCDALYPQYRMALFHHGLVEDQYMPPQKNHFESTWGNQVSGLRVLGMPEGTYRYIVHLTEISPGTCSTQITEMNRTYNNTMRREDIDTERSWNLERAILRDFDPATVARFEQEAEAEGQAEGTARTQTSGGSSSATPVAQDAGTTEKTPAATPATVTAPQNQSASPQRR